MPEPLDFRHGYYDDADRRAAQHVFSTPARPPVAARRLDLGAATSRPTLRLMLKFPATAEA